MLVIRQKHIYRADIQANRNLLYIFGDNLARIGFGGQAREMRGEPNSFGIATKRQPSHNYYEDYFHDEEEDVMKILKDEFEKLDKEIFLLLYQAIVIPMDGIGTGLSRMQQYAPKALEFINQKLKELESL